MRALSHNEARDRGLGILADPTQLTGPVDIAGLSKGEALRALETMTLIRVAEEVIADLAESGEARTPCHLGIGQEAVAVGVCSQLRATDRLFGTHRSHAQYLAMGCTAESLIAEILGRATGCSAGMGGSMHLIGVENGFWGSVPIVAGTIPIAVGAGLAARMDGNGDVAICFFGDGASEEGGFHEALNLAVMYNVPVIFVCENNLYSSHLDIAIRQPSDRVSRFADANHIPVELVDGNDVVATGAAAARLVARARSGGGPGFLEAVTYRWRGHVGPNENIDVGIRRSKEDLAAWKKRDPIQRLAAAMQGRGFIDADGLVAINQRTRDSVQEALAAARDAPYPEPSALRDLVFAQSR